VGAQFKQKDTEIIVVGKLLNTVIESVPQPELTTAEPVLVAPVASEEGEKQVVVVQTIETEKKKRRLKKNVDLAAGPDTLPPPPV